MQSLRQMAECCTPTRDNALIHCSLRGVDCIFKPQLFVLQFRLSCCSDLNKCHATNKLCKPLLQLLLRVITLGVLNLLLDLLTSLLKQVFGRICHNDGRILFNCNTACDTEVFLRDTIQLPAKLFCHKCGTSDQGNVLQSCFSVIPKPRRLDGAAIQNAPQLVDYESCQYLFLNGVSNDEERPGQLLGDSEDWNQLSLRL
mmetsp:Transcript_121331/g.241691  ORF Transcript_121331/g.241691 Transcript_121331/m.241691 type:complete len:200 (+) Transcript_121331:716-1315(+)